MFSNIDTTYHANYSGPGTKNRQIQAVNTASYRVSLFCLRLDDRNRSPPEVSPEIENQPQDINSFCGCGV